MTLKEDEKEEIRKIFERLHFTREKGSLWLMCETPGEKLAVFAAAEHWKDWESTFASIPAAQQEVYVLMRDG